MKNKCKYCGYETTNLICEICSKTPGNREYISEGISAILNTICYCTNLILEEIRRINSK